MTTQTDIESYPKLGASWEGFILEQVIRHIGARPDECFFWATHAGAELDLLIVRGRQRWGFEIKRTSSPQVTASMRTAWEDLKLTKLDVVHAGEHTFPLTDKIRAVTSSRLLVDIPKLK